MIATIARRVAVLIAALVPPLDAVGLWLTRSQPSHIAWENRIGFGTLAAAGVLTVLVVAAGPVPQTSRSRALRWVAAVNVLVLMAATSALFTVRLGRLNCGGNTSAWAAIGSVPIVGSLLWPWVLDEAPSRWTRWLIGPAAGAGLIAAFLGFGIVRAVIWPDLTGCG